LIELGQSYTLKPSDGFVGHCNRNSVFGALVFSSETQLSQIPQHILGGGEPYQFWNDPHQQLTEFGKGCREPEKRH